MTLLAILPDGFETQMIFGIEKETMLFLLSVLLGVFFGLCYEVLRILRRSFGHHDAVVFIEDFLFVIACGLCYYVFVTALAWGQLRGFILSGCVIGMFLERITVGNALTCVVSTVICFVKKHIFKRPTAFIVRNATKVTGKFVQNTKSLFKKRKTQKKRLKENENLLYNDMV